MKIFIALVVGCLLGWFGKIAHASYLYEQVQAETGGDIYEICNQLLNDE